jgi:hypothetical protein
VSEGPSAEPERDVRREPRVGGWGWLIAFFGLFGGIVGYLSLRQDDPRRADHVLKWSLIASFASVLLWVAMVAVLAAILTRAVHSASTDGASGGRTAPASSSPSTAAVSHAQASPVSGTAKTWTMMAKDGQGYSATVVIGVDLPIRPAQIASSGIPRGLVACSADPNSDAIIPMHVSETNTTAKLAVILGVQLQYDISADVGPLGAAGDIRFSSGSTVCDDNKSNQNVYAIQWTSPLAPGAGARDYFYLVVRNFYMSDPNGDVSDYQHMGLDPVVTFGDINGSDSRSDPVGGNPTGDGPSPVFGLSIG